MSDIFELTLDLRLRDDLTPAQLAELGWHLGLRPQPDELHIVTDFPDFDEEGTIIQNPHPVLGVHGDAWKIGGTVTAALDAANRVTCRQELHPDQFDEAGTLLAWLGAYSASGPQLGTIRFYEDTDPEPLTYENGTVSLPE